MTKPVDRRTAARHVAELEQETHHHQAFWEEATRRFAALCAGNVQQTILDDARRIAVDAYEALLDSVRNERDALRLLDSMQRQPRRPTPPHLRYRPGRPPKDPA